MTGVGVGHVLADRYRLLDLVAQGAMGEVWRGRDDRLDRDVAVKVLRPELADDEDFLQRFRVEARHAAAVRHPHVAAVHDYGEDPAVVTGGAATAYLVMDLIDGRPLHELLADAGTLPPARVAGLLAQVADALGAAHAIGLVHRDVKPANMVVDPADDVTVTDFGIARATDAVPVTRTGLVMGTAEYLSPEQARGRRATTASDVYSLGIVGYELLTGEPPFSGGSPATVAAAHVNDPVPPLPGSVPKALADTVLRCLAKEPEDRPDVAALAARLSAVARALSADAAGRPADDPASDRAWATTGTAPALGRPAAGRLRDDGRPAAGPDASPPPHRPAGAVRATTIVPQGGRRAAGSPTSGSPTSGPDASASRAAGPGATGSGASSGRGRRRHSWTRSPLLALLILAALLVVGYLFDAYAPETGDPAGGGAGGPAPVVAFHVERTAHAITTKDGR